MTTPPQPAICLQYGLGTRAAYEAAQKSSQASFYAPIAVAITGVGLVGGELINQILALSAPSPFRIVSLSSSKHTLFSPQGLSLTPTSWKADLLEAEPMSPDVLQRKLIDLVSPNGKVVFVDNTSSEAVAARYPSLLEAGVNVITPNKKAFSGDAGLYDRIVAASKKSGAKFLNESTVGAGLPIISTLKDLVATGDKVHKIEGVFSGTMSYIFNNFSNGQEGGPSFSSVVRVAREKGYTEPHPADDLSGSDVARKLAILTRTIPSLQSTIPLPQGFKSVPTTTLIPEALSSLTSPESADEFTNRLVEFDSESDKLREDALKDGAVLRYVGVIDVKEGIVKADLQRYPKDHAFATSLGGSDNIISFHTERYGARPLIVQGAGAGAAVTAMGVLSDLLKLV
ncbi:hypothetical protein NLI96_g584 [Meripilus lineatus]|uniref:Homoserine dehydrogenase n=1 Tax=Meripilus lineatus TaxID=2056292 RepID=A0AAD5YNS2_9APHY|nr:hypothetical protein NLI96_g584 [Physisporinus lineatus]